MDKIGISEKLMLVNMILDTLNIEIERSGDGSGQPNSFEFASIRRANIECVVYKNLMVGESYKLPLTMSLLGLNESLVGIRATVFSPETCED